jgi:hypothetical protein
VVVRLRTKEEIKYAILDLIDKNNKDTSTVPNADMAETAQLKENVVKLRGTLIGILNGLDKQDMLIATIRSVLNETL